VPEWFPADRAPCALLLLAGALVYALRPAPRVARAAWTLLLIAAVSHALVLSLRPQNLINNNNLQQYLGAKYVFRYPVFQSLLNAARGEPQLAVRDLEHPGVILREDPRARRAYYIDLLRAEQVPFDPFSSMEDLRRACAASGALRREADRILSHELEAGRIESFRRDVQAAAPHLQWADITTDYGFNGSPFYALLRHLDPTLYQPFGRIAAIVGLLWQALSVGLVVWILHRTFRLDATERIATAALVFSSWDFTGYALPGLTFAGLWISVAAAGWAVRHGHCARAGACIASAGLLKLYPFILLLPSIMVLAAHPWRRRPVLERERATRKAWITLGACALAVLAMGAISTVGGRSWGDFFSKIAAQFGSGLYIINSVSVTHFLHALGVEHSVIVWIVPATFLGILCLVDGRAMQGEEKAFHLWAFAACAGLVTHVWFNYYAMAPLFLVPLLARRHRPAAVVGIVLLSVACALPDFDSPRMSSNPLRALKIAPYLVVPMGILAIVVREQTRIRVRVISVVMGLLTIAVGVQIVRAQELRRLEQKASAALDEGDLRRAQDAYEKLLRLHPGDAVAEMDLGIVLAQSGRLEAARVRFAHAADRAPEDPVVVQNLALCLRRMNRPAEAAAQLERVSRLVPWNDDAWYELALIRDEQGRHSEALRLVTRALELNPSNRPAALLRGRLLARGG
jgi:Tfp pilus assembly protein PilF/FtsH-binding integral membrane protein